MRALAVAALLTISNPARADDPPPSATDRQAEIDAAWQDAEKVAVRGPAPITLRDQAVLQLPGDEAFVPQTQAAGVLRAYGNTTSESLAGLIVGTGEDNHWLVTIHFIKDGYIEDGDAKDWNADDLLKSLREGTEAANRERARRGFPELEIIGWVEPPAYDNATHRLVWSLSLRDHDAPADRPQTINYNTYALGRDGFFSLNLVTGSDRVAVDKDVVRQLLGTLVYLPGKRYEDFDESTDKVAAYGLAALIGAVAVKKLGLLALGAAFFLKIWKVGMLAVVGAVAGLRRFFKRRERPAANS